MISKLADGTLLLEMGKGTLFTSVVTNAENYPLGICFCNDPEKAEDRVVFQITSMEGLAGFLRPLLNLMDSWNTTGNDEFTKAVEGLRKDLEPFFPKKPINEAGILVESSDKKTQPTITETKNDVMKKEKPKPKFRKADFVLIQEAFAEGRGVAMTSTVERKRTELNEQLSTYFRTKLTGFKGNAGEDDVEDILDSINDYMKDKGIDMYPLSLPLGSGTDVHLIPITPHLSLRVLVADEYHGSGESSTYCMIDFFIIDDQATEMDVDALIDMLATCEIK